MDVATALAKLDLGRAQSIDGVPARQFADWELKYWRRYETYRRGEASALFLVIETPRTREFVWDGITRDELIVLLLRVINTLTSEG